MVHFLHRRPLAGSLAVLFVLASCGFCPGWQESGSGRITDGRNDLTSDGQQILDSLKIQAACWNTGDIEGFMETYWKNEAMTFSSGGSTFVGWQAALDRYRKNYPQEKMGQLTFEAGPLTMLAPDAALLLGKYSLDRNGEVSGGNFSLVLRRFPEGWRIIHDHSSSLEEKDGAASVGTANQTF